mmetsp:Transcript_115187/g.215717  ORF Transcript_115187/g.215717 Transcript_115187/m.215717 type:complete len:306 (+) Transcript_115187:151-1068(+)
MRRLSFFGRYCANHASRTGSGTRVFCAASLGGAAATAAAASVLRKSPGTPLSCTASEDLREISVPASQSPSAVAPKSAVTRVFIMRHGETVWNAEKRIQGQLDVELNDNGRLQAQRAAEALGQMGILERVDAVVSSDLARASQTADIIWKSCPQARRFTTAGLREVNFGEYQGQLSADVDAQRGVVREAWAQSDFGQAYPGGENAHEVMGRGLRSLKAAAKLGETVIVASHGTVLKWSAIHIELDEKHPPATDLMELPNVAKVMKSKVPNCCCSTLVYNHETDRFHSEGWFQVLSGIDEAKDDSG